MGISELVARSNQNGFTVAPISALFFRRPSMAIPSIPNNACFGFADFAPKLHRQIFRPASESRRGWRNSFQRCANHEPAGPLYALPDLGHRLKNPRATQPRLLLGFIRGAAYVAGPWGSAKICATCCGLGAPGPLPLFLLTPGLPTCPLPRVFPFLFSCTSRLSAIEILRKSSLSEIVFLPIALPGQPRWLACSNRRFPTLRLKTRWAT